MRYLLILLLIAITTTAHSAILFETNFDSTPDWTKVPAGYANDRARESGEISCDVTTPLVCASDPPPGDWTYYKINGWWFPPAYTNGLYIDNRNYRGTGGKALTVYNEGNIGSAGDGWGSDNLLLKLLDADQPELWVRYYSKTQPNMKWAVGRDGIKSFRTSHYDRASNHKIFEAFKNAARAPIYIFDWLYSTVYGVYQSHSFRCDPQLTNYYCEGSPQGQGDDNDRYILASGVTDGSVTPNTAGLWADGNWHKYDIHIKMNTYAGSGVWNTDGVLEFWYDGIHQYTRTGMQWIISGTDSTIGWNTVEFGGNGYNSFTDTHVMNHAYTVGETIKYSGYTWTCIADHVLVNNKLPQFSGTEVYWSKGSIVSDEPIEQWYAVDDIVVSTTEIPVNYVIGSAPDPVNGTCGMSSESGFTTLNSASAYLCIPGNTVTSFAGTGPWTWGCNGSNGGTNTSSTACSAQYVPPPVPINGVCGPANGGTFSTAPASNMLCSGGTAGNIVGQYNWVCSGSGGGTNTNCSANYSAEASITSLSPPGGTYPTGQTVAISCTGPCSEIHYCISLEDCTPTTDYTGPFMVSQNTSVRHSGSPTDNVSTDSYTITTLASRLWAVVKATFR